MDREEEAQDERGEGRAPVVRRVARARVHFAVGTALSRTFSIFARYLPLWLLIGVVAYVPIQLYALQRYADLPAHATEAELEAFEAARLTTDIVIGLMGMLLGLLVQVFTTHATLVHMNGERVRLGETLATSLARLPSALGTVLLMLLAFAGLGALGIFAFHRMPFLLLLLAIPVVMLWFAWFLGPQVAVAEKTGPAASLRRSALLTKGQRMSIFAALFLLGLLTGVAQTVVTMLSGVEITRMADAEAAPNRVLLWAQAPIQIASTALTAIFAAVAYHDLRVSKDGVSSKDLADIFA